MTLTIKQWKKMLNAVKSNGDSVFEAIKKKLEEKDPNAYKKWEREGFSISHDFDIENASTLQLLHIAVASRCPEVVKYLVEKKDAKVDQKSKYGHIPLTMAVNHGYLEIVKYLVKQGANVGVKVWNNALLHLAARNGHLEVVKYLVEQGAKVNEKGDFGYIPLCLAAQYGHLEVVKYLVEQGAKIDEKNTLYDNTSLHLAVKGNHLEIVKFLLESGANVNAVDDRHGLTPLDEAVSQLHINIAELIVNQIGKLEAAGLYVSEENLQKKDEFINTSNESRNNYLQHLKSCKEEVKSIKKRNVSLYDFLKGSNVNELVSIWEKNEDVRNNFDNQESLKEQYPEYAHILINKANKAKKEVFLHNHKPLIDVLAEYYEHDFHEMEFTNIKAFFQKYKDNIVLELGKIEKHLIDFLDFKDIKKVHVPRLELYAFAEVIKNKSNSSSKHQTIDQACFSSVDEQVSHLAIETTGNVGHMSTNVSEHNEVSLELESNGNQQSTQPEFLTTNGNSSNIITESGSTKIPVSDQKIGVQNNNQQPSNLNNAAPRSEKKSKVPIVATSTLAIAGVALGIAIAVYLEMPAVGIAVGACCLVIAAIIKPSKSLENSNTEAVVNQITVQNYNLRRYSRRVGFVTYERPTIQATY